MSKRMRIRVSGIVQGVGFRPFVCNLARSMGVRGFILNDPDGVVIEAEGEGLETFLERIEAEAPPLAVIEEVRSTTLPPMGYRDFQIRESLQGRGVTTLISPDVAVCRDCLRELFDPGNRRYLYPFINCTNCGPRYTITHSIPYDRSNTTMKVFRMCRDCEREYNDPRDRRFHAQPNGCPECGPRVELRMVREWKVEGDGPIERTIRLLKDGAIVAVKGLGGFHLACDAGNDEAVMRLREGKRRSNKPFAVMVPDMGRVRRFCEVEDGDEALLTGYVRPIVIMRRKGGRLSPYIAPGNDYLGLMLPYTPLHYLLFYYPMDTPPPHFDALVMTSGNISEEPIAIGNDEAIERLSPMVDAFLLHNRDIYMRADDSVVRGGRRVFVVRRARGYVPNPIDVGIELPQILALGGELKTTFCITRGRYAILSQHIGDMENKEAIGFYMEALRNLRETFKVKPEVLAHDLHPNYWTTGLARDLARKLTIPSERVIGVQHHHAHVVSCMAEARVRGEVIGVALDGTGYGLDGRVWGGEFLIASEKGFERFAHLRYIPMPGGERAIREPFRMAISYLHYSLGKDALHLLPSFYTRFDEDLVEALISILERGINSPLTSSCGRLFDAVSSILGIRDRITFEGEAAIELEMVSSRASNTGGSYPYSITGDRPHVIDTIPIIVAIVEELRDGKEIGEIGRRFHNTIAEIICDIAKRVREERSLNRVVLTGGCFQNSLLLDATISRLEAHGFEVFTHRRVPPNDGGLSLGQAVVASSVLKAM